jgi:hypothetical protein
LEQLAEWKKLCRPVFATWFLTWTMNEAGVLEWEDRKSKKIVVSTAMDRQTIHHGVNRNLKHITVIACVAASGEHVIPYIITSQESDHLLEALKKKGIEFGFGRHLILKKSQKPYVKSKFFAECVKSTFIPHVTRIRAKRGIEQDDTVLLMDNCPSHHISPVM